MPIGRGDRRHAQLRAFFRGQEARRVRVVGNRATVVFHAGHWADSRATTGEDRRGCVGHVFAGDPRLKKQGRREQAYSYESHRLNHNTAAPFCEATMTPRRAVARHFGIVE